MSTAYMRKRLMDSKLKNKTDGSAPQQVDVKFAGGIQRQKISSGMAQLKTSKQRQNASQQCNSSLNEESQFSDK